MRILNAIAFAVFIPMMAIAQKTTRTMSGDTTVIITQGNGLWGASVFVPKLVLTVPETSPQTTIGHITGVAATPDGGVIVFDPKALEGMIVRKFDRNGKFVKNIGRKGSGPGEYSDNDISLAVAPDGIIFLREGSGRMTRYSADGMFLNTYRFSRGNGGPLDIHPGPAQSLWLRIPFDGYHQIPLGRTSLEHFDASGKLVDSILPPSMLHSGETLLESWSITPDGGVVQARVDRYGFVYRPAGNGSKPLRGEVAGMVGAVFSPGEREEIEDYRDWLTHAGVQMLESYPAKPGPRKPILNGNIALDDAGRVWLTREVSGEKVEPHVIANGGKGDSQFKSSFKPGPRTFAVFKLDGTFLGESRLPKEIQYISRSGDFMWATILDADGTEHLTKWRAVP